MNSIKEKIISSASLVNENFDFSIFSKIYFIGLGWSFHMRAAQVTSKLPGFLNKFFAVVGKRSSEKDQMICGAMGEQIGQVEIIEYEDFLKSIGSTRSPILIVDFNDSLGGRLFAQNLASERVHVIDVIQALYHLNAVHTYLSVKQEREYYLTHVDDYLGVLDFFEDAHSRNVLIARLMCYATLDRKYLFEVQTPDLRFSVLERSNYSLCISDNEVYADIGAAHGDTAIEFYNSSRGRYQAIHAFEPDSQNYSLLATLCNVLPLATAHYAGVGAEPGEIKFYENEANRFGSNFLNNEQVQGKHHIVPVVKIDDVTPDATLMKIDVEGFEKQVILGAQHTIRKNKPKIHISGYHYPQDIPDLVRTIQGFAPYKSVALRHCGPSLYDSNLMFSDNQSFAD